jgi:hypothetical protein
MSFSTAPNSSSSFWGGTCRSAPKHLSFTEHYLSRSFHQLTNEKLHILNGLKFSVWTSRGAGLVLAYTGGLILLPMLRNIIRIIRPKLTWLFPADENIWFHRQVAYSMAFWAMVHTTAHYVNFINVERTRAFSGFDSISTSDYLCRGPNPVGASNPLHTTWWHYRPFHAIHHALDIFNCSPQDTRPMFRSFLVHAPPCFLLHDRTLHARHRLLRPRFGGTGLYPDLPLLFHAALPWL